ncbi:MAG: soluble cytochrome b562 [Planctomycetota bacterium]|jgi:soluble cytochrome b562
MKTFLTLLLCCSLVTLVAWSNVETSTPSAQEEKKSDENHEKLEKEMKRLKGANRRLKKLFRKKTTKSKDIIADLHICQAALLVSRDVYPSELKGEKNAKKLGEFQSIMIDCLIDALNAEKAALAGDMKKAKAGFDAMNANQKKGHDKFRE